MAKTHTVQTSFLTGVLDPRAKARVDTDAYAAALLEGVNVVPSHLGGVKRRPGTGFIRKAPYQLQRQTSGTFTAPNGGTAANGTDDDPTTVVTTTNTVGTTTPFVVVHHDLGVPVNIKFADVIDIISLSGTSTEFRIQYSTDNAAWTDCGDAFALVDYQDKRTYRREVSVIARYWRVVKIGGTDMGAATITIGDFLLWAETADVSAVKVVPFEISTEDRYVVLFTDRTASLYKDREYVESIAMPYGNDDIADLDASNDAETMVIVHEDYPQRFLLLDIDQFQTLEIVFDTVPEFDYNDSSSPTPVTEVQVITFAGTAAGNTFQIGLDDARTATIIFAGDSTADEQTATAANIAREVQRLWSVPGFTGVACERTGANEYTVAFGDASAKAYRLMQVTPLTGSWSATVTRSAAGVSRSEPVWSATRGYPRTVAFFEGRMFFGGTRSRQQTLFGSFVGNILDFKPQEGLDDEPLYITLLGQQLNAINGLYSGRALQVFTSGGEFRFAKQAGQAITPTDAPSFQTGYGSAKVRPTSIDGSTMYLQRNRKSIRDFKYNYEEDAYDSLGVSSLAPHLINDVAAIFSWNGSRVDEIGLLFVINGDGTIAVLNSRKDANIQAWTQWTTDGYFRAGAAVVEDIYFAVERDLDGPPALYFEYADANRYMDCSVVQTGAATDEVTGLSHLNGVECRVRGDGFIFANVTPASGEATVENEAATIEVGLGFNPTVTPMPLFALFGQIGPNIMRKRRIVKVRAKVNETLGLRVNGRVLPDRQLDVNSFDDVVQPYTGNITIEECTNWDEKDDKTVTFDQVDPLPFEILGIDVQMESNE